MVSNKGGLKLRGTFNRKTVPGKPLVSIITVCLNSEKHLEQTIRSVLSQSYDNIEYIVIDGGSTDKTLEIVRRYEDKIACWLSEPDRGIYDAMNKGISLAEGDWIGIINSDDWYAPDALRTIVNAAADNPEIRVFSGDLMRVYLVENGRIEYRKYQGRIGDFFREFEFLHPTCFVARQVYEQYRFNLTFRIAGDYDLMARLYFDGVRLCHLDRTLAYFRGGVSTRVSYCAAIENYRIRRRYDQLKGLSCLIQDTGVFLYELLYCIWQPVKKKFGRS